VCEPLQPRPGASPSAVPGNGCAKRCACPVTLRWETVPVYKCEFDPLATCTTVQKQVGLPHSTSSISAPHTEQRQVTCNRKVTEAGCRENPTTSRKTVVGEGADAGHPQGADPLVTEKVARHGDPQRARSQNCGEGADARLCVTSPVYRDRSDPRSRLSPANASMGAYVRCLRPRRRCRGKQAKARCGGRWSAGGPGALGEPERPHLRPPTPLAACFVEGLQVFPRRDLTNVLPQCPG